MLAPCSIILAGGAGADHHVGVLQEHRGACRVLRAEGPVSLDQHEDVAGRGVQALPARVAIAPERPRMDDRPGRARELAGAVGRAVVHHDHLVRMRGGSRGRRARSTRPRCRPGSRCSRAAPRKWRARVRKLATFRFLDRVDVQVVAGEHEREHRRAAAGRVIDDVGELEPSVRGERGVSWASRKMSGEKRYVPQPRYRFGTVSGLLDQAGDAAVGELDGVVLPDEVGIVGLAHRSRTPCSRPGGRRARRGSSPDRARRPVPSRTARGRALRSRGAPCRDRASTSGFSM